MVRGERQRLTLPTMIAGTTAISRRCLPHTRGTKSYDNILFDRRTTAELTGSHGVLNLMAEYSLTMKEALKASDHFPVWAEFSVREGGPGTVVASRPESARH